MCRTMNGLVLPNNAPMVLNEPKITQIATIYSRTIDYIVLLRLFNTEFTTHAKMNLFWGRWAW